MAKTRARGRGGRLIVVLLIIFMLAVLVGQMVRLRNKNEEYNAQIQKYEAELDSEQTRQDELVEYEMYVNSDKYIEDEAHSKLGMAYEDEIIFREK